VGRIVRWFAIFVGPNHQVRISWRVGYGQSCPNTRTTVRRVPSPTRSIKSRALEHSSSRFLQILNLEFSDGLSSMNMNAAMTRLYTRTRQRLFLECDPAQAAERDSRLVKSAGVHFKQRTQSQYAELRTYKNAQEGLVLLVGALS